MTPYKNETLGWEVTKFHCIFGDIQIAIEPGLNECGYENSGIIIGESRLVHYVRKGESSYTEEVQGEEATRNGILVSDALGLKGNCHIWIDGGDDDDDTTAPGAQEFRLWGSATAPTGGELEDVTYVFAKALTITDGGTTIAVEAGDAYTYNSSAASGSKWTKYYGPISAN